MPELFPADVPSAADREESIAPLAGTSLTIRNTAFASQCGGARFPILAAFLSRARGNDALGVH
jgi:hypothetical protein